MLQLNICFLSSLLLCIMFTTATNPSVLRTLFNEELTSTEIDKLLGATGAQAPLTKPANFIEDHYFVVFKSDTAKQTVMRILEKSTTPMDSIFSIHRSYSLIPGIAVRMTEKTTNIFRRLKQVKYVEYDATAKAINDFPSQGIFCNTQKDAKWCLSRCSNETSKYKYPWFAGSGATIYVVDSGVNYSHPDLGGRAKKGWNFVDGEDDVDYFGHGTSVADVAAGKLAGVAKSANIISVKVLNNQGTGPWSKIIAGIEYVTRQDKGIINLSLGGDFQQSVNDAVTQAISLGFFSVIAAGNSAVDACTVSPASTADAYTVGATDINNQLTGFTNFGTCLDLFAPGQGCFCADHTNGGFSECTGTSFSAPYVSGWAAVELGHSTISPDEMTKRLNAKLLTGVVQGDLKNSPNKFIYAAC